MTWEFCEGCTTTCTRKDEGEEILFCTRHSQKKTYTPKKDRKVALSK